MVESKKLYLSILDVSLGSEYTFDSEFLKQLLWECGGGLSIDLILFLSSFFLVFFKTVSKYALP